MVKQYTLENTRVIFSQLQSKSCIPVMARLPPFGIQYSKAITMVYRFKEGI